MAKRGNNLTGKRSSSHNTKPYDANNSFVKKVATKVTDLIPQKSWISKWFNSSQSDGDVLNNSESPEEVEPEEDIQKPPPLKRPCIRMDVTHPPGTFSIQPRTKSTINKASPSKQQCSINNEMSDDFCKPAMAGPSGMGHLVSSTPTTHTDIRNINPQRSELNSLVTTTNNGTTSGMDDNSESSESTSGCSSLIPQTNRQEAPSNVSYSSPFSTRKRFNDDKLSFTNRVQSPRSLFLDNNTRDSLSSRRPSFNASIVTNSSDHASPLSSPFYSGNTTYGGANAAGLYKRGRSLFNNSNDIQLKVPKRTCVEVKPSNATGVDSSGMSQTAKKILEALEHFSSPITDAKKIPLKTNNTSLMNKKRSREETTTPSARVGLRHLTRELTVPTVPDILKLRQRKKLQDTTAAARKIISARNEPPPLQEYHLRTETDDESKPQGKLKSKAGNLDQEETVQPVNLPNIPLPISSLPNFNFIPPSNPKTSDKIDTSTEDTFTFASPIKITNVTKNLKSINNFTFSSPINAEKQSIDKSNDSNSPLKAANIKSNIVSSECVSTVTQNFVWSGSSTAPRPKEKVKSSNAIPVVSNELKSGSVMDVLCSKPNKNESDKSNEIKTSLNSTNNETNVSKDDKKPSNLNSDIQQENSTLWECSECLFKNNSTEMYCFACKASKLNNKKNKTNESTKNITNESKTTVNFGSEFKLSSSQWECISCLVRNKQTDNNCVACGTVKQSTKQETNVTKSVKSDLSDEKSLEKSENLTECSSQNVFNSSSLKSLQKDTNTANKTDTITSQNIGSESLSSSNLTKNETMSSVKPNKDTWECPCCMVRNVTSVDSCPCCNTSKPSTGVAPKTVPLLLANGFGDKFKKPEGAWNCDTCMLQNEAKVTECVACGGLKPGSKKLDTSKTNTSTTSNLQFNFCMPPNAGGFKFGIDKADQEKTDPVAPTNGFKFGDNQQSSQVGQFTFGIQKEEKKTVDDTLKSENSASSSTGSGFGLQVNTSNSDKTDVKQNSEQVEKRPAPSFSFGVPKSESESTVNDKQSLTATTSKTLPVTFTFGVPNPKINESDAKEAKQSTSVESTATEISKTNTQTNQSPVVSSTSTLPSISQTSAQQIKPTTSSLFGVPSSTATVNSSSSTNVVSSLPSSTQPSFTFLETKPAVQTTSAPTFGQISAPASTSTLPTTFAFGETKTTESSSVNKTFNALPNVTTGGNSLFSNISNAPSLFSTNDAKNTSTLGTEENKQPTFDINTNKLSTFAVPETKVPTFGSTENKPSIFGSSDTKMPVFGNTDKTASPFNSTPQAPAATPFGVASGTPNLFFGSSATPNFSNNTPSTFTAESTPNIFGSSSKPGQSNTSSSNLFTFGSTSNQPVAQPGFNFSTNTNPAESTQKPLFTFGSSSTVPQSSNLFGNTFNNTTPASSSGFTFNAPKPETPTFGQPTAATPIFGTPQAATQNQPSSSFSSTPSNTGFNFGSFGSAPPPPASSGGFSFGAMAHAAAPSTGFNFNPPSNTPTFDPYTPPSFNFTGGNAPPTFNATPTLLPQRKIKKAVRKLR
nr:PREDICTED: nuclear pore complex protein Nup153-like isoform X1 [Megachile rotundata]